MKIFRPTLHPVTKAVNHNIKVMRVCEFEWTLIHVHMSHNRSYWQLSGDGLDTIAYNPSVNSDQAELASIATIKTVLQTALMEIS